VTFSIHIPFEVSGQKHCSSEREKKTYIIEEDEKQSV